MFVLFSVFYWRAVYAEKCMDPQWTVWIIISGCQCLSNYYYYMPSTRHVQASFKYSRVSATVPSLQTGRRADRPRSRWPTYTYPAGKLQTQDSNPGCKPQMQWSQLRCAMVCGSQSEESDLSPFFPLHKLCSPFWILVSPDGCFKCAKGHFWKWFLVTPHIRFVVA